MDTESTLPLLKALANEKRLQILQWLLSPVENFPPQNDGDLIEDGVCISYITDKADLSQPTVTRHMKILGDAGLVTSKQIKNWVFYKPDREAVDSALADLNQRLQTSVGKISASKGTTIPEFTTSRLILRAPVEADIPCWQAGFNDYEVIRNLNATIPWPFPDDGVRDHFENTVQPEQMKDRWFWAICLIDDPKTLIGIIEIRHCERVGDGDNRGFWLAQKFWGQGLMSEALVPVMSYAFNELGFKTMTLSNATRNRRSSRVKKRHGARFVATAPGRFVDPTYTEKEIWEITREEWEAYENGL